MKSLSKIKLVLIVIFCNCFAQINAQVFTKITTDPVANEANNSYYAAWADYDNDNDLDLFHSLFFGAQNNPSANNLLFQNNCSGGFNRVTQIPGGLVSDGTTGPQSCWVDYDNDGDQDLFTGANFLYQNLGNGSFTKVVNSISTSTPLYTPATWVDYNNDGRLDMYRGDNIIHRNDGGNVFTPVTIAAFSVMSQAIATNGMAWCDYDNDGDMDVYVCKNSGGNFLFRSNGVGGFFNVTFNPEMTANISGYGCAWGDVNNDGLQDLWINGTFGGGDRLFINNGGGAFTRNTTSPIVNVPNVSQAGASFADYDNDGDLDLMVPTFNQNLLFTNGGTGNFTQNTTEVVATDGPVESYAAAWADYDNDGDLDLFVPTAFGDPNDELYRNNVFQNNTTTSSWIKLKMNGNINNKNGVGAKIRVRAVINGVTVFQTKQVNINTTRGGESGGASGQVIHFGCGNAGIINQILVTWPNGTTQTHSNVTRNTFYEIRESNLSINPIAACTPNTTPITAGTVSGTIYNDINQNCVKAVTEPAIANKWVRAVNTVTGATFFAQTNNNGLYTLNLPTGTYTLSLVAASDNWQTCACQLISYAITINSGTNLIRDFALFSPLQNTPCGAGRFNVQLNSIGIDNASCPTADLFSQTPCPNSGHRYCVTVTNNTTVASANPSVVQLIFPNLINIDGATLDNNSAFPITLLSGNLTNTGVVQINGAIPPGGQVNFCIDVLVEPFAVAPFVTTANFYNASIPAPNLLSNGNFEAGNTGIASDYYQSCQPTFTGTPPVWGDGAYCVTNGNNISELYPSLIDFEDHTFGTMGGHLMVVGGDSPSKCFYEAVVPVAPNTNYLISGWFTNLVREKVIDGYTQVNTSIAATINGALQFNSVPTIPEIPHIWRNYSNTWCSGNQTTANVCFFSPAGAQGGNNFGVDDLFLSALTATASITETTACACDPNDKNVEPKGCGINGIVAKNQLLNYTIRFQNTGTGPATNVLLRDVLDDNLDISTLQILSSSHTISRYQIIPNNALIIEFDSIMLPPSLIDEEGSNGYVIISILPKTNLADGTQIQNQVGIYFDGNEVVLTNSVLNTLYDNPVTDASFIYKNSCATPGIAYDFTYIGNTSNDATFAWTFDDAQTTNSSLQNPSNIVFNSTGAKLVSLTVNRNGCIATYNDSINVDSYANITNGKIEICHNGNTLLINQNAIASHIAHGDCIGACASADSTMNKSAKKQLISESKIDFEFYPNPANTQINVKINTLSQKNNVFLIELYNFSGTKVLDKITGSNNFEEIINTTDLPTGIYLMKVRNNNESSVKKVFIQH